MAGAISSMTGSGLTPTSVSTPYPAQSKLQLGGFFYEKE